MSWYYLKLRVRPANNIGPPQFSPALSNLRLALGENGNYLLPNITDPDPEDFTPSIFFKNSQAIGDLIKFDFKTKSVIYSIPKKKP